MKYILFLLLSLFFVAISFAQESDGSANQVDETSESEIEMQVVASKVAKRITDTSADVTIIDEEELEKRAGSSVTDVLREHGIVALDDSSSRKSGDAVYIQGLSSDKLLIVIDGQRVRDGTMGSISALKRIPLSSIERIEVIKGPSSFLWGSDAMAGVIYIQTKKGSGEEGLRGSLGSSYKNNFYFDDDNHFTQTYLNLNYGWANGNSVWFGSSVEYGNTWVSPYTITTLPLPEGNVEYKVKNERDDFLNFDVYGGVKFDFLDINSMEITSRYQQEYSPLTDKSVEDNDFKKFMANVNYKLYALDNLDIALTTGVSYDAEERVSHNQSLNDYYVFNNTELLGVYYLNDIFTLKGGYGFDLELFDEVHNNKIYNQQTHALFFGGDADIDTSANVDIDITAGVRYQATVRDVTDFGNSDVLHSVSPEVGVVIKPLDWLGVKLHVGHSFKVPELLTAFRDYFDHTWFYAAPNPDLKPESAWGYSGSLEFYPLEGLTFSVGAFRNDLKNLIAFADTDEMYNGVEVQKPINIGKAYTWGINGGTTGMFDAKTAGIFSININFELLWAKEVLPADKQYIDNNTGDRFNPHLANRPAYTVSGSASWYKSEWGTTVRASGFYFGQGYEYEGVTGQDNVYIEKRTEAYTSLDLRVSQEVPPHFIGTKVEGSIYFEVKNLLDSTYDNDDDGDTDRPERQFVLGFDLSF